MTVRVIGKRHRAIGKVKSKRKRLSEQSEKDTEQSENGTEQSENDTEQSEMIAGAVGYNWSSKRGRLPSNEHVRRFPLAPSRLLDIRGEGSDEKTGC